MTVKWTDTQVKRAGQMIRNGKTFSEIADAFKTTRSAIASLCKRKNLRETPFTDSDRIARGIARKKSRQENQKKQEAPLAALNAIFVPLKPGTVGASGRAVLNLKPHDCRWPIGDPRAENFRFCGKDRDIGVPYCTQHQMVSRVPKRP